MDSLAAGVLETGGLRRILCTVGSGHWIVQNLKSSHLKPQRNPDEARASWGLQSPYECGATVPHHAMPDLSQMDHADVVHIPRLNLIYLLHQPQCWHRPLRQVARIQGLGIWNARRTYMGTTYNGNLEYYTEYVLRTLQQSM